MNSSPITQLARLLARQAVREHFTALAQPPRAPAPGRSKRVLPPLRNPR
jgi:hypothetical protein